jgi:two-component system sensor histidine kinase ArlS
MNSDFPNAYFTNGKIEFHEGKAVQLPSIYNKTTNHELLREFYTEVLEHKTEEVETGIDPLGFTYFHLDYICIVGIICFKENKSNHNNLKKKFKENQFSEKLITHRLTEEHKLENNIEHIPIKVISQNLHEIRGLNAKVTSHIDAIMNLDDEELWEERFDNANENIRKIYVASRLTKFILDNTKFYDPKFFDGLELKHDRYFVIHRSVSKIIKIYRNDFKVEKTEIDFSGNSFRKLSGDKEYFEVLIKILVENAIKYSPYKKLGPKIIISENGNEVKIETHSYGQIIPKEDHQHLFTSGFRSSVNKGKAEGTGMGLYNAKRLTEKFRGTIDYKSRKVEGTENLGWNIFILVFENTFSPKQRAIA